MGSRPSTPASKRVPTWDELVGPLSEGGVSDLAYHQYTKGGSSETKTDAPYSTTDKTTEVEIRASSGPGYKGSLAMTPARTLVDVFKQAVAKQGNAPALRIEENVAIGADGKPPAALPLEAWKQWTYKQYYDECCVAGQAFIALGLERYDAVNVYGFNSPEWFMADMGCILAGGIAAGIYPTDTREQVKYKSLHSGAAVACVEDSKKVEMFRSLAAELPKLKAIVVWAPEADAKLDDFDVDGRHVRVLKWSDLKDIAAEAAKDDSVDKIDARMADIRAGQCCTYIYTSGTTGEPKAVMISHDNICFEAASASDYINGFGDGPDHDRIISYLPLSHVAGMMVDIVCPLVVAADKAVGVTVHFARAYDLKAGTIGDRLRAVHPTCFLGVPRVWEKIQEKMVATVRANPPKGVKLKIARWAKKRGLQHQMAMQLGGDGSYGCCYNFADKKVLSVVKQRLGLDECKFAFTGAAPIKVETLEYFGALGIQINEVYGMSECTGAVTWSTDDAHKWGSCGWPLPSMEVKILKTEGDKVECPRWDPTTGAPTEDQQGEVCYRGRNIMMGYMANPDLGEEHVAAIKQKNADAIDDEGWLHSGDKGVMDTDGMVKITGRYKELIIGAGGENIAPVPIEDAIKAACPAISNIMMVGDKRKFNVALVTLKAKGATGELPGGDDLDGPALELVPGVTTISAAIDNPAVAKAITDVITAINKDTKVVPSPPARIQKFTILRTDFSVATDELTPTLKLKRSVVQAKHEAQLDRMYASKDAYIPYPAAAGAGAAASAGADADEVKVEE